MIDKLLGFGGAFDNLGDCIPCLRLSRPKSYKQRKRDKYEYNYLRSPWCVRAHTADRIIRKRFPIRGRLRKTYLDQRIRVRDKDIKFLRTAPKEEVIPYL